MYDNAHIFSKDAKFQSLIGNVQHVDDVIVENGTVKGFQSLIGNVQQKEDSIKQIEIKEFQSLIGNVQPQHFRHF